MKYSGSDSFLLSLPAMGPHQVLRITTPERGEVLPVYGKGGVSVRRNSLCPCGSKKKFKNCCRRLLREPESE